MSSGGGPLQYFVIIFNQIPPFVILACQKVLIVCAHQVLGTPVQQISKEPVTGAEGELNALNI